MMFQNPYFGLPYYHRYSRYGYYYPNPGYVTPPSFSQNTQTTNQQTIKQPNASYNRRTVKNSAHSQETPPKEEKKEDRTTTDSKDDGPIFQIFGIDLYFDDILLVCLIFFLYQEGVKDQGLFIALILLLLS